MLAVTSGVEGNACLEGLLLLLDPPQPGIEKTVSALAGRGILVRIISGCLIFTGPLSDQHSCYIAVKVEGHDEQLIRVWAHFAASR